MKKIFICNILIFILAFPLHAQEREVRVYVEDGFLKKALSDVKISVLNTDSTMVVDSLNFSKVLGMNGMVLLRARYSTFLPAEKKNYLLHVTKRGYSEVWHPISVPDNKTGLLELPTIRMRKSMERDLSEVEVKATRVKMYYRGDTIVYNADAFNLPDGSMLDALIRQLPGVKMTDKGEIYVNGRKVDELLLGSRSFLRGNRKVLLENLPYYTVENIKAYNKRTDKSEALGYDVEAPRYVMDVNLKKEYSIGYIANLEGAAGTRERWMGRVCLLGFNDILQYGVMGNINNLNETNHIGERGYWRPTFAPLSPVTTRSAASFIDYASKDRRTKDHLDVNFTSTGERQQSRQWYEQFVENGSPTSTTESFDNSDNLCAFKVEVAVMVNHLDESLDFTLGFFLCTWLAPFLFRLNLLTTYIVTSQSFLQHLNEREVARKINCLLATIELVDGSIQSNERLACTRHTSNETDGFALMFSAMVNDSA